MNLPNKLSLIRIALIPVFVAVYFISVIPFNHVISAAVFLIAAGTDFLDGHIARKYNMVTNLGKFLDPIADKVLVSSAFIVMLTNGEILSAYYAIAIAVILGRELIISGFRTVAASKNLVLAADKLGKIKTFCQDLSIIILLVGADFLSLTNVIVLIGRILLIAAAVLTVVSGVNYIVKNKEVLKG